VNLQFRSLLPGDLDTLFDLWSMTDLPIRPGGREDRARLCSQMEDPRSLFLGAFHESALVGAVLVTHDGRKGWINRLAVHPDHRHHGVARLLMREAERFLLHEGIGIVAGLIEEDNHPSRALFSSEGYEEVTEILYYRKHLIQGS